MTKKHPLQVMIESSDGDLRPQSYSGRGMYGKQCLAVVGVHAGAVFSDLIGTALYGEFSTDEKDAIVMALCDVRQDSLGHDTVVYFPRVEYVGGSGNADADDEEDDEY